MSYKIFRGAELSELAQTLGEQSLLPRTDQCWINLVRKDHPDACSAEMHDHELDIYLVVDGNADLHLGGTLIDPTSPRPGQHNGTELTGSTCYPIATGDVVVIPAGTPHMLDTRHSTIAYLVMKVTSENV